MMSRDRLAVLATLAALAVPSCVSPPPDSPRVVRFIEEENPRTFDPRELFRPRPVIDLGFATPESVAFWRAIGDTSLRRSDQGMIAESAGPWIRLQGKVDFEAATVDAIVVETAAVRATMDLRWAGPGAKLIASGIASQVLDPQARKVGTRYHFFLADHPDWHGRIDRLQLQIRSRPTSGVELRGIEGDSERPLADDLAAALASPWKVDFDRDRRNALLGSPARPISKQLTVSPEARLRFAYAVPATVPETIYFRVAATSAEVARRVLFEAAVEPPTGNRRAQPEWRNAEVDLSALAGQTLRLTLETHTERPLRFGGGFPVWGHPEVISGDRGPTRPNVVLISIDTLRADHLSVYGYSRQTTPNLDAWAKRSAVVFRNVVAPSPWTQPSHVSLFTGLDAHRHGVNGLFPAPASLVTLAEVLRQAGYATGAVTGSGVMNPDLGLAQGFDRFFYNRLAYSDQELETSLADALSWLETTTDRPFFLFFHTYEIHTPYLVRQPWFSRFSSHDMKLQARPSSFDAQRQGEHEFVHWRKGEEDAPELPLPEALASLPADLYDSAVAYTDERLNRLLTRLEAPDLADRTIVVLTSDHGEMLGEHDLAGHHYLYDENLRVPLIMALPEGRGSGRTVPEQVRSIDVFPTLLELAGLEPVTGIDGRSLLPLIDGTRDTAQRPAWSYAARSRQGLALRLDNRVKYIRRIAAGEVDHDREELYDLAADPREEHDLTAGSTGAERFRDRLRRAVEEEIPGYRLRFENTGEATYRGQLRGPRVRPGFLAAIDMPCPCVVWQDGRAAFEVPPGVSFTLILERPAPREETLHLKIGADGMPDTQARLRLDPDQLSPRVFGLDGISWTWVAAGEPVPAAHLKLWWQGGIAGGTPTDVTLDGQLQEELEALGYVQ